jgi:hypothetical protein
LETGNRPFPCCEEQKQRGTRKKHNQEKIHIHYCQSSGYGSVDCKPNPIFSYKREDFFCVRLHSHRKMHGVIEKNKKFNDLIVAWRYWPQQTTTLPWNLWKDLLDRIPRQRSCCSRSSSFLDKSAWSFVFPRIEKHALISVL